MYTSKVAPAQHIAPAEQPCRRENGGPALRWLDKKATTQRANNAANRFGTFTFGAGHNSENQDSIVIHRPTPRYSTARLTIPHNRHRRNVRFLSSRRHAHRLNSLVSTGALGCTQTRHSPRSTQPCTCTVSWHAKTSYLQVEGSCLICCRLAWYEPHPDDHMLRPQKFGDDNSPHGPNAHRSP